MCFGKHTLSLNKIGPAGPGVEVEPNLNSFCLLRAASSPTIRASDQVMQQQTHVNLFTHALHNEEVIKIAK